MQEQENSIEIFSTKLMMTPTAQQAVENAIAMRKIPTYIF
jgi:hypothetical protein